MSDEKKPDNPDLFVADFSRDYPLIGSTITLRDLFAKDAAAAYIREWMTARTAPELAAEFAYRFADAMLAERAKGGAK